MARFLFLATCLWAGCSWVDSGEYSDRIDLDRDGVDGLVDCDDQDAAVREPTTWYGDGDGDGYGDDERQRLACTQPDGFVENNLDCDDDSETLNPSDADSDGASTCDAIPDCDDGDFSRNLQDVDGDGFTTCDELPDCDDGEGAIFPGAEEVPGDARDQDCDGVELCYLDVDEDGSRDPVATGLSAGVLCSEPGLLLGDASVDCDDTDAAVAPGADERCNDIDDDCDGAVDEDPIDPLAWYFDFDEDGSGDENVVVLACQPPLRYVSIDLPFDCDDGDASLNHNDEDGDGETSCEADCDDDDGLLNSFDLDGDFLSPCEGDCDDFDPDVHPGAVEDWYDGTDGNCDGQNDYDQDGDGYIADFILPDLADGTAPFSGDCNDRLATTNPGATEWCGDYEWVGDVKEYVDSDCDHLNHLPDTVSGLLGGVGLYNLVEDPSDPSSVDMFSAFDPAALDGGDSLVLGDFGLEMDEIAVCARADESPWLMSMDLSTALTDAPLTITGIDGPVLDGSPGGFLFSAAGVTSGYGLVLSGVTIGGNLDTSWLSFTGVVGSPMSLVLVDVDFGDVGRWGSNRADLIHATDMTLVLSDVTVDGVSVGADVTTFLTCQSCIVESDRLRVANASFLARAMDLVDSTATFGALEALDVYGGGDGAVARVIGGVTTFTPDDVITDPDIQPGGDVSPVPDQAGFIRGSFSEGSGGGLHISGGAIVDIDMPIVSVNAALGNGGAVYVAQDSAVTLQGTSMDQNTALNGGAIYTEGTVVVERGHFTGNVATERGGAVYLGLEGDLRSSLSQYTVNEAVDGGAVYLLPGSWATFHDGDLFSANVATDSAGAIWVSTLATLIQSTFQANSAEFGGALVLDSGLVHDVGSDYNLNYAELGGGAVEVDAFSILALIDTATWDNLPADVRCEDGFGSAVDFHPESGNNYMCGLGYGCNLVN